MTALSMQLHRPNSTNYDPDKLPEQLESVTKSSQIFKLTLKDPHVQPGVGKCAISGNL
jgi:hypothetical protein